ncbi:hypothetical protein DFJ74DRAFT_654499 [Hyaloraphidium curvatum]|nr:hypothetical protein DFJ74DRAFT_654499 [Hyaloraphidium curvatum]
MQLQPLRDRMHRVRRNPVHRNKPRRRPRRLRMEVQRLPERRGAVAHGERADTRRGVVDDADLGGGGELRAELRAEAEGGEAARAGGPGGGGGAARGGEGDGGGLGDDGRGLDFGGGAPPGGEDTGLRAYGVDGLDDVERDAVRDVRVEVTLCIPVVERAKVVPTGPRRVDERADGVDLCPQRGPPRQLLAPGFLRLPELGRVLRRQQDRLGEGVEVLGVCAPGGGG